LNPRFMVITWGHHKEEGRCEILFCSAPLFYFTTSYLISPLTINVNASALVAYLWGWKVLSG
jgi:hypothetical protein